MTNEQFRQIRESAGKTQTEVAEFLGVSLRAVQYYEAGDRAIPPPVAKLMRQLKPKKGKRK